MIKKSAYLGVILLFLFSVISCEKDFTDIGSSVINNNVFETKDTILDIFITQEDVNSVRADGGIALNPTEFLLGVYKSKNGDFRTIEASIVSQVQFLSDLKVVDQTYGADTTVVTKMDKVLIRIPYQATNIGKYANGSPKFRLDSILGDTTVAVSLKVYENLTFLNTLDPANPTQTNMYKSDAIYAKGDLLNDDANFSFTTPQSQGLTGTKDTLFVFNRNVSLGVPFEETIKITNSAPFFTIPLDTTKFRTMFLEEYSSANFESPEAFNDYFRGLIIEASGSDGSLIPFNLSGSSPTLDIYYTNTVVTNGVAIDTILKNNSFPLNGVRNSIYKPGTSNPQNTETFAVQGTAGTMASVNILQGSELQFLRDQNWLINDASLTFYIDKSRDTIHVPRRLFLFKNDDNNQSQIKDVISEGINVFGGQLINDESNAKDRYRFRITDYISDFASGESSYNPTLGLKVFNPSDLPNSVSDTVVRTYNWNARGVVLHSNTSSNSERKAQLKISYSIKK